jgi:Flp pilus assembly pilin Flp
MKFRSVKKLMRATIFKLIRQNRGQAMVEYAILSAMVVGVALYFNKEIISNLNDYYALIANMVSLPIP